MLFQQIIIITWLSQQECVDEMEGSGTQSCVVTIIYHYDVAEALSSAGNTRFGSALWLFEKFICMTRPGRAMARIFPLLFGQLS